MVSTLANGSTTTRRRLRRMALTAVRAIFSGVVQKMRGGILGPLPFSGSGADANRFVATKPGQSAVTPRPSRPYSARRASLKPTIAYLLVQ